MGRRVCIAVGRPAQLCSLPQEIRRDRYCRSGRSSRDEGRSMAQPEKRENSVLFSLRELRQIEESRVQEEEHAVRTAEQARIAAAQEAERKRREAEEAKVRAERDELLRIETARENAEREARMRVESAEAMERQRVQAALEQQRLQHEMELRCVEVVQMVSS